MTITARRCAIYTRKSTEEGLEQGFNSLHAQREACEAYVLSQAGEGWAALTTTYDDGGFSGGSMERPGLKALLADIDRGLVDIVVVYKVDRLTRSLADFAKIVELFDKHEVSFVSVTQAFNTTTSMGRLTLNVLLSFAQFEREVTGERIRDKIAASKAKGMWMGGRPPLGYDGVERKLVVNPAEAQVVRHVFDRYLELGSVTALAPDLKARGVRSKRWTNKQGELVGGAVFSRGALYHLLANPVYRGAIRHRERLYHNAHPAIIDEDLWSAVQGKLAANCPDHPETPRLAADVLLRGLLFDDRGEPMRPLHTKRGAKRYRYYLSAALRRGEPGSTRRLARIAMGVIDRFVLERAEPLLSRGWRPDAPTDARVRDALTRVTLGEDRVVMTIRAQAAAAHPQVPDGKINVIDTGLELAIGIRLKHRQGAILIDAPGGQEDAGRIDRALVRAVCLARGWAKSLAAGEVGSTKELARQAGLCNHYAARLMPLAWLAPDLVAAIMEGHQPRALSLGALVKRPLPMDWGQQRQLFESIGLAAGPT
jgi:DNA invertase Pin-like site-specific DNA recombinase